MQKRNTFFKLSKGTRSIQHSILGREEWLHEIYPHLTFLYNEFLKNKTYPCKLKKAIVTPIYKKKDPELPENFRPISITGALSKVFEKLLYKQINEYLISQKFLSNTQFGFQTSYSTIDAIFYCTDTFRKAIANNKTVASSLLDLSKAFDSIDHTYLKQKLKGLNFSEEAIEMINSFIAKKQLLTTPNPIGLHLSRVSHRALSLAL